VTSISSSGRPYTTPKGHSPAWTSQVDWQRGDALQPDTYSHLLPKMYGVVHTIGTLFEGGKYKEALRKGDMFGTLSSFLGFQSRNPLDAEAKSGSYQVMNRDTALRVCEAFTSSKHESSSGVTTAVSRPFVYVSAEDILRPVVPAGYIESKRDAEVKIETIVENKKDFRPVFIRPGLVYHAHLRPMLSPAAVLLDISAGIHAKIPRGVPTPSDLLRNLDRALRTNRTSQLSDKTEFKLEATSMESIANALSTPPIHVEHVAEAICVALEPGREDVRGAYGVRGMRDLIGWTQRWGQDETASVH
jgi:hypothetical protein